MKKQLLPLFLLFFFSISLHSQSKYSRVKIDLTKTSIKELSQLGLETDHGFLIPGVHFVNDFSNRELDLIKQADIPHFILIDDLKADYKAKKGVSQSRAGNCDEAELYDYVTPENYTYGSMGGYHTYDEMLIVLTEMKDKYPDLITTIESVEGIQTWDDNEVIWLRISDNPDVDEEEPEVLYTALHHAREPNGLSQMIFYMWYLLENYETDPDVKYLVDNTEMYFMPCVNPDGYKYNELTDPDGGGFWRKNRRPDEDEQRVGVDLNRNYGFFWGFDDSGSSPNMQSNTYRGPQGFSEPETQAVREFCIAHNFQICLNYHTFGNLLIHPWGYNDQPTAEDSLFKALGHSMAKENSFKIGTGTETVGYVVNGDSDDYMYGDEAEKNKIYSFTPEVGAGFWPQQNEIDQLNKSCVLQNINAASLLLNHYEVSIENIQPLVSNFEGSYELKAVKAGLMPGAATVRITSNNLDILTFEESVFQLELDQSKELIIPINYTISENSPSLQELSFDVELDNGEITKTTTYDFVFRNTTMDENTIDDFANLDGWDSETTSWGLTTETFVSEPSSLTDSPNGDYDRNVYDPIQLTDQISLEDADFTSLKFSAKWNIEFNYDYALVQVSNDNGANWTSLCGNYTRPGVFTHGTFDPLYDGFQEDWIIEEIDLTDYQDEAIDLRLLFVSDGGVELDGFYIDDLIIVNNNLVMVGTDDILELSSFDIVPSLNNGTFSVNIDLDLIDKGARIEILDINGRVIMNREVSSNQESFDLEDEISGVYIVKIVNTDGMYLSKKVNVLR